RSALVRQPIARALELHDHVADRVLWFHVAVDEADPVRELSVAEDHGGAVRRRYGRYRSPGSSSAPTSSRRSSTFTERASTPSSEANHASPALWMTSAASGEIAPSGGQTPLGLMPKARSCDAIASSSWKAASSG